MPFCPKCKYEYEPGVSVCPDCNETLIDHLPEENIIKANTDKINYEDWVKIGRLTSYQYAEMILEGLRGKEIPAVILSGTGHFGQTGQLGVSSFRPIDGAYSVLVPKDFVDDANLEAESILGEVWTKARVEDH
jgi:hypothetical protein